MTQAESVHSTPRTNSPLKNLALQEARRVRAIKKIAKLRRRARDQIVRLINFLDQSDEYVMTELEDDDDRELVGDEEASLGSFDAMMNQEKAYKTESFLDAELDSADEEPSLGFLERHPSLYGDGRDSTGSQNAALLTAGLNGDREEEHDGSEPSLCGVNAGSGDDRDREGDDCDDEPSLGWTIDGCVSGPTDDREEGGRAARPKDVSHIPGADQVHVEVNYRKILHGLTESQREALRRRRDSDSPTFSR